MVRRTRGEWSKLVAEYRKSGQSAAQFASRRGLNPRTLAWWGSRLGRRRVAFAAVEVFSERRAPSAVRIEALLPSGVKLALEVQSERETLDVVLAALGGLR